ncbi:SDR family NAD(P)-dependent oxidoreductase [Mesorhizobium sp. M6A.T.Ce.TU.016.01.1.1]|uniref:SDR family oxidoreductase n=1 Tax=Mesorhizobium sp. M6A.T.Ce.TU.016.01.1.1 TaxID=2496783 RepID=UPI000FCADCE2|nr:SDR family NAD(P)-dependent oxidoreductase [Mesorhizobium sp. M6A.T.Ce.TU.016.01.1.1]
MKRPPPCCLITGATGGLGRAVVEAFHSAGFHTIVTSRDQAALEHLAERLGGRVTPIAADLREPADVRRLAAGLDRLDVVVAGAGRTVRDSFGSGDEPLEDWRDAVLVNIFGTAAIARVTLPLVAAARGTMVLVGSVTGRAVVPGDLYSVTKHGVSALAEALRLEAEAAGVQVCVVQPGLIDTPMVSLGRKTRSMMTPEAVAAEILRLATGDHPFQVSEIVLRPLPARQNPR